MEEGGRHMPPRTIYLVKDLARATGFSVYTIKFYLKIGLIKEFGRGPDTRYRYFNGEAVKDLRRIRALRRRGLSLKEIGRRGEGA